MSKRTGRPASGTVTRTRDGRLQAIITLADGSRKRLKPFKRGTSEEYAKARAEFWAQDAQRRRLIRPAAAAPAPPELDSEPGESVAAFLDRLLEHRTRRGLKRQNTERGRLRNHVEPVLVARNVHRMQDVGVDDCRAIVEELDRKSDDGELGEATAFKCWAMWALACKEACSSKVAAFRVRDGNPARDVQAPNKGTRKAKQWIYPGEFSALMNANVPVRWRRIYALTIYMCLRAGELGALECEDVDLAHGRVRINRSMDRETRKIGPTKTKDTRELDVPPTLVPLLAAMVRERKTGRLLDLPPFEDLAETLRKHLARAGITRRELAERTDTSSWITFHDLRATGISWMAMRPEVSPFDIRDYAGHSEISTTDRYVRRGKKARGIVGEPFPDLPDALVHPPSFDHGFRSQEPADESVTRKHSRKLASPTGFEPVLQP